MRPGGTSSSGRPRGARGSGSGSPRTATSTGCEPGTYRVQAFSGRSGRSRPPRARSPGERKPGAEFEPGSDAAGRAGSTRRGACGRGSARRSGPSGAGAAAGPAAELAADAAHDAGARSPGSPGRSSSRPRRDLPVGGDVGGGHRVAGVTGLGRADPEALEHGGEHGAGGRGVEPGELLVRDGPERPILDERPARPRRRAGGSARSPCLHPRARAAERGEAGHGLQQQREVLPGLDVADVQHERARRRGARDDGRWSSPFPIRSTLPSSSGNSARSRASTASLTQPTLAAWRTAEGHGAAGHALQEGSAREVEAPQVVDRDRERRRRVPRRAGGPCGRRRRAPGRGRGEARPRGPTLQQAAPRAGWNGRAGEPLDPARAPSR